MSISMWNTLGLTTHAGMLTQLAAVESFVKHFNHLTDEDRNVISSTLVKVIPAITHPLFKQFVAVLTKEESISVTSIIGLVQQGKENRNLGDRMIPIVCASCGERSIITFKSVEKAFLDETIFLKDATNL